MKHIMDLPDGSGLWEFSDDDFFTSLEDVKRFVVDELHLARSETAMWQEKIPCLEGDEYLEALVRWAAARSRDLAMLDVSLKLNV